MKMTKGTILKICAKRLRRSIVEKLKMVDNQKETYFSLTFEEKRDFVAYELLREKAEERWLKILKNYSEEELVIIRQFITDMVGVMGNPWECR
ncbi:hypothetical protein L7G72_13965 [Xenorhabdus bovienii]|uniref:hypothetical protein n=1 Tax=Xenorhabdus bovienii TaxID=40576 RepID=UPI001EDCF487|nr:hypothetical protein [Xenorhabdus bovienii]MCG3462932.1 hypothetical protein [Xenorhabdus bovienii]